uniref:LLGL scribble cell polarity complex component 1 n=1 Tax=Anas platyrhynchos TaxID=8839 RepID=A0A8B9TC02_ANAPL
MMKFRFRRQGADPHRERLRHDLFAFSKTVEHGFPSQPSALAYDPQLRVMAIGTKAGAVKLYGAPGVELTGLHKETATVTQLHFLAGQVGGGHLGGPGGGLTDLWPPSPTPLSPCRAGCCPCWMTTRCTSGRSTRRRAAPTWRRPAASASLRAPGSAPLSSPPPQLGWGHGGAPSLVFFHPPGAVTPLSLWVLMLFALGRRQARSARVYTRLRRGAGVGFGRGAASCEALCCLFGLGREAKKPQNNKKKNQNNKKKNSSVGTEHGVGAAPGLQTPGE